VNPDLIPQWLAYAAPVCFAGLGGLLSEKAGVVNIALEGQMLVGALAGAAVAALTGNPWLGVAGGFVAGAAAAGIFALLAIGLRRDQVIVGTTLNFLALGTSGVLARAMTKANPQALTAPSLPHAVAALDPVSLASLALVPILWWWIHRTRAGVALRACGERPAAAAGGGFHVNRIRTLATLACGALCGLGGTVLSIGISNNFAEEMTAGRGFVALAVVVFGRWTPQGILGGALLFAAADMLQTRLQAAGTIDIPYPVFLAIPYILTLGALAVRGSRANPPAALGEPWETA